MDSAAGSARRAEIVLADDASTDDTARDWRLFERGPWPIRYHRNADNAGFLRTCNAGAQLANGQYLCFLNNDVEVASGWLDVLLSRIESDPTIGAVGPMFLDETGRILECGGMVHSDGTAQQLGRGATLDDRRFQFMNDVDYISAACLVLGRDLFAKLHGFDERYAPCFYEDADLCLKIAVEGLRVVVDPRVRLLHREGSSSGANPAVGLKQYQDINRDRFFARWRERLAQFHPSVEEELPDRIRTWRREATIVCHASRDEESSGSETEALNDRLSRLAAERFHVVAVFAIGLESRDRYLHRLGIETLVAQWGDDPRCVRLVHAQRPRAVLFADPGQERRFGRCYYRFSPSTVRVLDCPALSPRLASGGHHASHAIDPASLPADMAADLASAACSDLVLTRSQIDRQLLTEHLFFEESRVVERSRADRGGTEDEPVDAALLLDAVDRVRREGRDPRWRLAQRMLWHARGRPGSGRDFNETMERLGERYRLQRALLEQFTMSLQDLRETEARLSRDLTQSLAVERALDG